MKFELAVTITDEMPGVDRVVVRSRLKKNPEDVGRETTIILPVGTVLTEDNPVDLIFEAFNQKLPKKKVTKKKEEKADGTV